MNGIDLSSFPFDYDLTFMAFFTTSQGKVLARYGGREDGSADAYLNKASLIATMNRVLEMHNQFHSSSDASVPQRRANQTPESILPLQLRMLKRGSAGKCIHCHDVKQGMFERDLACGGFSRNQVNDYPMPSVLGIELDPSDQTRVRKVAAGSLVAKSGMEPNDRIVEFNNVPVITAADIASVLHSLSTGSALRIRFLRDGSRREIEFQLPTNWRSSLDPSWRSSLYLAGPNSGFWGEQLSEKDREKEKLPSDALALRLTLFFKNHSTPRDSLLQIGDILLEINGDRRSRDMRQVQGFFQMHCDYGQQIPIVVRRAGQDHKLTLCMPSRPAKLQ